MRRINILNVAFCVSVLALGAGQAQSEENAEITLKSLDGSVIMIGEFQGFEAGHYNILVSGLGLVSIAEGLVTCQSSTLDCATLVGNS